MVLKALTQRPDEGESRESTTTRFGVSRLWLAALAAVIGVEATAALADDAANAKIIEYYRRKSNLPPEVEVTVTEITDAKIPGAKTATLTLARGGQTQKQLILMSPDGRYVVFGELEDVTSDPFKAIAAKIKTDGKPTRGPKDAKVTIVEYSDFQCPYCARAHATVADQVMKEYDGKVKLVYKNFPLGFHPWAEPAGDGRAVRVRAGSGRLLEALRLLLQGSAAAQSAEREGEGDRGAEGHQGQHGQVERLLRQQEDARGRSRPTWPRASRSA